MAENEKKKNKALVPILLIILIVVIVAVGIIVIKLLTKEDDKPTTSGNWIGIGYEQNATILTSGEIAYSQPEGIAVRFNPLAVSADGENFECEIANSYGNTLDMYLDIYVDLVDMEEIYLSGLMRPGEGITHFKTNRVMPKGTYDVVLVLTLVEDDHQTIHSQSNVALTLYVE